MRSTMTTGVLEPLSQTNLELVDQREDIRDLKVHDRNGQDVGKIDEVFIDPTERRARFVSVKSGDFLGMGGRKCLIPIEAIRVQGDRVTVDETAEYIAAGPLLEGDLQHGTRSGVLTDTGTQTAASTASDAQSDPVVFEAYRYYKVDVPFWDERYQQPNWR